MLASLEQKEALYLLWDRVADCDGADVQAALTVMLEGAAALMQAGNACFTISVRLPAPDPRDPMLGWRMRELFHLWDHHLLDPHCKENVPVVEQGGASEPIINTYREAGRFRGQLLRDIASPAFFESPEFARDFGAIGVRDAIFVTTPLGDEVETSVAFYRTQGQPTLTPDDAQLAEDILRPLKWLQRRVALSHGLLMASDPITPAERRVLQMLLTDRSEKDIAAELGLAYQTVHKHVKNIYKKLGVSSRAGVAALWLGTGGEGSPTCGTLLPSRQ